MVGKRSQGGDITVGTRIAPAPGTSGGMRKVFSHETGSFPADTNCTKVDILDYFHRGTLISSVDLLFLRGAGTQKQHVEVPVVATWYGLSAGE